MTARPGGRPLRDAPRRANSLLQNRWSSREGREGRKNSAVEISFCDRCGLGVRFFNTSPRATERRVACAIKTPSSPPCARSSGSSAVKATSSAIPPPNSNTPASRAASRATSSHPPKPNGSSKPPIRATALGCRDRAILEVLYATGLRRNELRHLKPADIDREQGLLRVNDGKGGADRVVPLGAIAARCLETYANAIRPELLRGAACEWLFVSYTGRQIDPNTLNAIVRKYAKAAKVRKPVTCHTWRHSCATHLVQNNANVRHVQEMLGHRSLATTERYLRLTIADLKAAHERCHPRERGAK